MPATLQANNLVRGFGEGELRTLALRGVSVDVMPGVVTVLVGPSGSGKSTLVSVISGLMRPDEGTVHAFDVDLWRLSEVEREEFRRRHFGFIFQGYNLFPALDARQQLELVLRWGHGVSKRDARRQSVEMLESLGLEGKLHLRPDQLSGGEKQRVAIGRALIKQPEFLFADEPTSALDWGHGETVVKLLRDLSRRRKTAVLLVSHDPRVERYADRVLHFEDGVVVDDRIPTGADRSHG
ncbi:MAG: ABC transporter ATP-binding protein [Planctomycetia bacterium]